MPKVIPMHYDGENTIWIEAAEDIEIPVDEQEEYSPIHDVGIDAGEKINKAVGALQGVSNTIKGYCAAVMQTFDDMGESIRPDKAVIEFGIQLTGKCNVIVVKGTAQASLKVTAEWNFDPNREHK